MENFIKVNGINIQEKDKELEFSFGLMEVNMKDNGREIKLMEKEE